MQAWTADDGSIAPGAGAQGVYIGDTRIVRGLATRADGWSVAHLGTDDGVPRRQKLRAVVRRGGAIIDPEVLLVRERAITGDALTETITLVNASRDPVTVALAVYVVRDATPMDVVKAGGGTQAGTVLVNDEGWSSADERVSVRLETDGACARDELGCSVTWHLAAPAGGSAGGSWSLHAVDLGAVVTAPRSRDLAAAAGRIAVPGGRAFDLGRLLRRAFDDLDGLQLAMPGAPDATFIGAGAPWFLTLFGRDSIVAASLLLPAAPHIAHGTLATLARFQGRTGDVATAEAPGKIIHELRRDVTHHVGHERFLLPPRYYGTVDATPLWISLLHDAWRAGMPQDDVGALVPNLEAALGWLRAAVAANPRGLLAYHDPTGRGLANHGWKDSGDAIRWADGSQAVGPIALCEVQGYAARAARQAADLLDALGRDGAVRAPVVGRRAGRAVPRRVLGHRPCDRGTTPGDGARRRGPRRRRRGVEHGPPARHGHPRFRREAGRRRPSHGPDDVLRVWHPDPVDDERRLLADALSRRRGVAARHRDDHRRYAG